MKSLLPILLTLFISLNLVAQESFRVLSHVYLEGNSNEVKVFIENEDEVFIAGNKKGAEGSVKLGDKHYREGTGFFFKTTENGDLKWKHFFHGGDITDVVIDGSGNITVLGKVCRGLFFDSSEIIKRNERRGNLFISRHDPNGNLIWVKSFGGSDGYPSTLKVDSRGAVYLSGTYRSGFSIDGRNFTEKKITNGRNQSGAFFLKLNSNGNIEWAGNDFLVTDFVLTEEDDLIITGDFQQEVNINGTEIKGTDAVLPYIARLSNAGYVQWARPFITWKNTHSLYLTENGKHLLLSGRTNAYAIHYNDSTISFKTDGGLFYALLDYEGDFIMGQSIGLTSNNALSAFLRSAILTEEGEVFLSADMASTGMYINGEHLDRPWYNYRTIMKFSGQGMLENYYVSKSTVISSSLNKLFEGKDNAIWFGSTIRDSLEFAGQTFSPIQDRSYAGFLMVQIDGKKSSTLGKYITNSEKGSLPKAEFWVDHFDEIDRFGLKFTFPFLDYVELGYVVYEQGERGTEYRIISELDVSDLVEITREFNPRDPEDGDRLGSESLGLPYAKEEYGSYAFSLVRGMDIYSGTGLLWKKHGNAYKLVRIYPDFAGGGLYTTPGLGSDPSDSSLIVVKAIGGDEGEVWGTIYTFEVKENRLNLLKTKQVKSYEDIDQ